MSDLRSPALAEVHFICLALSDLAEQVREHCPVLHTEVLRSLALADYALDLVRISDARLIHEKGAKE